MLVVPCVWIVLLLGCVKSQKFTALLSKSSPNMDVTSDIFVNGAESTKDKYNHIYHKFNYIRGNAITFAILLSTKCK